MRIRALAVAAVVGLLAAACGGDDPDAQEAPATTIGPADGADGAGTTTSTDGTAANTTAPAASGDLAAARVKVTRVATLSQPVAMAVRAGDPELYVAQKGGQVRTLGGTTVLDLGGQVSTGSEQGLLGLVFSPDGRQLYVNYTDRSGDTHVVEYGFGGGRADPATARELLFVDQPFANHNGGHLVFGPDGKLWIGLGDGGSGNDPRNNAQTLGVILGKMLRIDPQPSGDQPYTIPADNPFVGRAGARGEVWSLGLRNPWRYSFDRATGDLWIGDVGQNAREEVDFTPAASRGGENYGWARLEGTRPVSGTPPAGAVGPIVEYDTSGGNCAVTGGYVYRGAKIPDLGGAYLYADFCVGEIMAVRQSGGRAQGRRSLDVTVDNLTSFGHDAAGELYALSLNGGIFRIDPA